MLISGIDLARKKDYSAVVQLDPGPRVVRIRQAKRLPQISWTEIIDRLIDVVAKDDLILIDAGGPGDAVVEQLGLHLSDKNVVAVVITAGGRGTASRRGQGLHISKHALVNTLMGFISRRWLKISKDTPGRKLLAEELPRFGFKSNRTGFSFTGKIRGGSDDVVMALCLATLGVRMIGWKPV